MLDFIDIEIDKTIKMINYHKARPLNSNNKYIINQLYKELKFLITERDKAWKSSLLHS